MFRRRRCKSPFFLGVMSSSNIPYWRKAHALRRGAAVGRPFVESTPVGSSVVFCIAGLSKDIIFPYWKLRKRTGSENVLVYCSRGKECFENQSKGIFLNSTRPRHVQN